MNDKAPVNHEEAAQLSALKVNSSNMARCYLDLHEQLAARKSRHLTDEECDAVIKIIIAERGTDDAYKTARKAIRQWFAGVMNG